VTFRSERARAALAGCALVVAVVTSAAVAGAAEKGEPPSERVLQARKEFVSATEHVTNARWGEALAAFERSAALRPHAITTYNIGACERALGRYTRARRTLQRALEADAAAGKRELPPSFAEESNRWLAEIETILVRATVTLTPPDAVVLVDGAPLAKEGKDEGAYVAGLPPSERDSKTPGARFLVTVDPGVHLVSISRPGFGNAVVTRTFTPGTKPDLALDLQSLPATIHIAANRPDAVVSVDGLDTGVAPVNLLRPAGSYKVAVRKSGYVPYFTTIKVGPGEQPSLQASLEAETKPLYTKFWFWATAVTVVAGAAVATYFIARPEAERPAPDGGGLGWVVPVPASGNR